MCNQLKILVITDDVYLWIKTCTAGLSSAAIYRNEDHAIVRNHLVDFLIIQNPTDSFKGGRRHFIYIDKEIDKQLLNECILPLANLRSVLYTEKGKINEED